MTVDETRLMSVKAYCRIDYDEDDALLSGFILAVDDYLAGAGCSREGHENLYDLIVEDMVLRQYDGRDADAEHAATDSHLHQSHHSGKRSSTVSPGVTITRVGRPHRGHVIFFFLV